MKFAIRPVFALENSALVAENNDKDLAGKIREAIARSPTGECIVQESEDGIFRNTDFNHNTPRNKQEIKDEQ